MHGFPSEFEENDAPNQWAQNFTYSELKGSHNLLTSIQGTLDSCLDSVENLLSIIQHSLPFSLTVQKPHQLNMGYLH